MCSCRASGTSELHRFIGNHDPAFSQQVLDIAEAEGEPGIQPDGLLNDYGWEAISGVADLGHDGHLRPQIPAHKPNNVTMPSHVKQNRRLIPGIPRLREDPKTPLAKRRDPDSTERMIRPGFLDIELRQNLIELARDGSAAHRLARRANALVLLDDGMSCEAIAKVLLLDDDTIRTWYRLYEEDGIEGLTNFSYEGSACQLSGEQQEKLKAWVATALPRTTRQVGAWIENEFGVVYEGRSGLIALLHRLGLEYHKPNVIPRKLDEEKQKAFIEGYEKLLNSLGDDEAVLFADAVHPTHAARPVGCWAPSQEKLAIEQTSGRQRINIHGAIDLETGQTRMIEALTIDAASTIRLLQSIEALYPMRRSSMFSWTTRVIIMPSSCRNGWPCRDDASSCTSSQRIART